MIVGIDEVGRGPWAGPLVVGAVILGDTEIEGLTDSKKLSKKKLDVLNQEIIKGAKAIGLGWVSSKEIDDLGLSSSLTLGCRRALEQINSPYHHIIIDGTVNFLKDTNKGSHVTTIARADALISSVSAASIVAKVARDKFMTEQDSIYPGYGFARHVGYGTALHRSAIDQMGVTPLHRLSFAPLTKYTVNKELATEITVPSKGSLGETAAADYLCQQGFTIKARNWRTKICEIDVVAEKKNCLYFVEVKYRSSVLQGGGIAAITPTKLRHMKRAAEAWLQRYGEQNAKLAVIEVSGPDYDITHFLEQV